MATYYQWRVYDDYTYEETEDNQSSIDGFSGNIFYIGSTKPNIVNKSSGWQYNETDYTERYTKSDWDTDNNIRLNVFVRNDASWGTYLFYFEKAEIDLYSSGAFDMYIRAAEGKPHTR